MKNNEKIFYLLFLLSFCCWGLPFLARIFCFEIPKIDSETFNIQSSDPTSIMDELMQSLSKNDKQHAFVLILKNNIRGCVINVVGGITMGLITLINLMLNGFYLADMFVASYDIEKGFHLILKTTLPHSFELIGFWLSGTIGFYIAWNIIQFMRGKEGFTSYFYKQVGLYSLITVLIILSAAYIEAYVSTNMKI